MIFPLSEHKMPVLREALVSWPLLRNYFQCGDFLLHAASWFFFIFYFFIVIIFREAFRVCGISSSTKMPLLPWWSEGRVLNRVSGSLLSSRARDRGLLSSSRTNSEGDKHQSNVDLFLMRTQPWKQQEGQWCPSECKDKISTLLEQQLKRGMTDRGRCSQSKKLIQRLEVCLYLLPPYGCLRELRLSMCVCVCDYEVIISQIRTCSTHWLVLWCCELSLWGLPDLQETTFQTLHILQSVCIFLW